MTVIIPEEKTSSSNVATVELEYVEAQCPDVVKHSPSTGKATPVDSDYPARTHDAAAAAASRESCCTQKCCHYCLAIWCCLILINTMIGVVIRLTGGVSNPYVVPAPPNYSPEPSLPSAVPTYRPSPPPSIGFSNAPTVSSMPTLANGFRSIANEPGVIHLVKDGDCQNCYSEVVQFPSPMDWSDAQRVTSMSVVQGGSIKLACGGADINTHSYCPDMLSLVHTQQNTLYDPRQYPSIRTNVYVLFKQEAGGMGSEGGPFATVSWEVDVGYAPAQNGNPPPVYFDVNWEVKLYPGYFTICYGASRIEPRYMREVRVSVFDSPKDEWASWYYPGAPLNEDGGEGVSFFPSNQCFSLGPKAT